MFPNPLFSIFGQEVYLYGICIAVGILVCFWVLYFYTKRKNMPSKVQDFIFFVAIIAIAIGFLAAKFYQAVYDWVNDGFKNFDFYGAGITVMGGLIGGAAAFLAAYFGIGHFYFKGKDKDLHIKHFNTLFLVAPLCILIAHAFGRLGCLSSGCCHGAYLGQEYKFGGIWMYGTVDNVHKWGYYVPTQLYESLFLFVMFAVLSVMYFKGCNIIMHIYLISYGVWRMFIEIFRTDYRGGFVLGLAPSQWQSVVFILIGVGLIVFYKVRGIPLWYPKKTEQKGETPKNISDDTE